MTDKSLLLINKPKCCLLCIFCKIHTENLITNHVCTLIQTSLRYDEAYIKTDPNCPLLAFPERKIPWDGDDENKAKGWNECIDYILGEMEDDD